MPDSEAPFEPGATILGTSKEAFDGLDCQAFGLDWADEDIESDLIYMAVYSKALNRPVAKLTLSKRAIVILLARVLASHDQKPTDNGEDAQ